MYVCLGQFVSGRVWAHLDRKEQFEVRKSDFFPHLHLRDGNQNCSVWAFLLSQHLAVPRGTLRDAQGTKSAKRCPRGQGDAQGKVLLRALETHKTQPCNSLSRTRQTGTQIKSDVLCFALSKDTAPFYQTTLTLSTANLRGDAELSFCKLAFGGSVRSQPGKRTRAAGSQGEAVSGLMPGQHG